jgi:predicted nucleic acid-binding protein
VLRDTVPFEIVEPTRDEVLAMQPHTAFKDAPILAAAKKAYVYCLVSLDRRHMIEIREAIEKQIGLKILLPSELLELLRQQAVN